MAGRRTGRCPIPSFSWLIAVTRQGIGESLAGRGSAIRAEIVANLPAPIRAAVRVEGHRDRHGRERVATIHRFYAPLRLHGRLDCIKLTVREFTDGTRRHYAVDFAELGPDVSTVSPGSADEAAIAASAPPGPTVTLGSLLSGVNYEDGSAPRWTGGALFQRRRLGEFETEPGAEGVDQAIVPGAGKRALAERASWCRAATASWLAPGLVAAAGLDGLRERHRTGGIRISGRGH